MELSLGRFAAALERGGAGDVEFLADSDPVSDVEEGSVGGWLAASGLREAHPEIRQTEITKTIKNAHLQKAISKLVRAIGSIRELHGWPNRCRRFAAFTGGSQLRVSFRPC
jgi:hypothetical protein